MLFFTIPNLSLWKWTLASWLKLPKRKQAREEGKERGGEKKKKTHLTENQLLWQLMSWWRVALPCSQAPDQESSTILLCRHSGNLANIHLTWPGFKVLEVTLLNRMEQGAGEYGCYILTFFYFIKRRWGWRGALGSLPQKGGKIISPADKCLGLCLKRALRTQCSQHSHI